MPVGATYQPITVTTNNLTAYSSKPFIVTFAYSQGFGLNSFAEKIEFPTGHPFDVAIGDLDGDGHSDLAVANLNPASLSIFRNTGTSAASFAAKIEYETADGPLKVSIGDLNGDGKLDLAVANLYAGTVSVFRNKGTRGTISFAPKIDFVTEVSPELDPNDVAIGDFDGDGKADLAVVNSGSHIVSLFRNTSTTETISFDQKIDFPTGNYSSNIAVGDLDKDGKTDLAVTNLFSKTVSLFRNISIRGTIAFAQKIDYQTDGLARAVVLGDMDGDGKPDLAVTNYPSSVSVFRNTSTPGTISFADRIDKSTGIDPRSIAMGDLDGDGRPDLVAANGGRDGDTSGTVSLFKNLSINGTIAFAPKIDYKTGSGSIGVAIGYLDGDSLPDLAVACAGSNERFT